MADSDGSRAAGQAGWARLRATITDLYVNQGKTLDEVIHIMRESYDFSASSKAYKTHFKQWNIQKNLRFSNVQGLLAQGGGHMVDRKRLNSYLRRLPPNRRRNLNTHHLQDFRGQLPRNNQRLPVAVIPFPFEQVGPRHHLALPDGLQQQSQCIYNARAYITRSSDRTRWHVDTKSFLLPSLLAMDWQQAVIAAKSLFGKGLMHQAFQILQRSCKDLVVITRNDDPTSLFYIFVVMIYLSCEHPEIGKAILRYTHQLAITFRSPYHLVLSNLINMDSLGKPSVAKDFADVYIKLLREDLGVDEFLTAELEAMISRQFAAVGLLELEPALAVHRRTYNLITGHLDKLPAASRSHPSHTIVSTAWLYYHFNHYDDARRIVHQLLQMKDIDKFPHAHEAAFKYTFMMDSKSGLREQAVVSGRKWVQYFTTWTAEPDRATDALSEYARYLRGIGLVDDADRLHEEFEKSLEEVREGVEDLSVVEEKYRRTSQGDNAYPTPNSSRFSDSASPYNIKEPSPDIDSDLEEEGRAESPGEPEIKCEPSP